MDVTNFNNNYLNTLLDKISKEQKNVFLSGDFDISLPKYNYKPTNGFLNSFASSHLIPYIFQLNQYSRISKTDNIFLKCDVTSNKIWHCCYFFRSLTIISYSP